MAESITTEQMINAAEKAAEGRFLVEKESAEINAIMAIGDVAIAHKAVLRLKRVNSSIKNQRTILIAILNHIDEYVYAKRWAAAAREELLDPELADLYLISALQENNLTVDKCTNMEANEQYCRKYFLRPQETADNLIERTFLTNINDDHSSEAIVDPLRRAFEKTATNSSWLDDTWRKQWKAALISGKSGIDLIEDMFDIEKLKTLTSPSDLNSEANETPREDNP